MKKKGGGRRQTYLENEGGESGRRQGKRRTGEGG